MIVINCLGKVEPMVISKKIGLTISNLNNEEQEQVKDAILKELWFNENYEGMPKLIKGLSRQVICFLLMEKSKDLFLRCHDLGEMIEILVKDMIVIRYNPMMIETCYDWHDYRTCETTKEEKFMILIRFVLRNPPATNFLLNNFVDTSFSITEIPHIITNLQLNLMHNKWMLPIESNINCIIKFGSALDGFIKSEDDLYKLDFITNALKSGSLDDYHRFTNLFSIIEMLLHKKNRRLEQIDVKLLKYLDHFGDSKEEVAKLFRKIRNKIAHGDFHMCNKIIFFYIDAYMQKFSFDEYENSKLIWGLSSINIELERVVRSILIDLFNIEDNICLGIQKVGDLIYENE